MSAEVREVWKVRGRCHDCGRVMWSWPGREPREMVCGIYRNKELVDECIDCFIEHMPLVLLDKEDDREYVREVMESHGRG